MQWPDSGRSALQLIDKAGNGLKNGRGAAV